MQLQRKPPYSSGCEYGRICVGTRVFRVLCARDVSPPVLDPGCARLNLCGENFVVVEATEVGGATEQVGAMTQDDAVRRLTRREREIAVLVAQGHPNKVISYRLEISEWTVAAYLRRIYAKLNVESRAAMVYRCASMIENLLQ